MTIRIHDIDVHAVYQELLHIHQTHLKRHGVQDLPELYKSDGRIGCNLLELICLQANYQQSVHKDTIATFRNLHNPDCGKDAQARHWKSRGWDVRGSGRSKGRMPDGTLVPHGHYVLGSYNPSPEFLSKNTRDAVRFSATDWDQYKTEGYANRCGVCGKPEAADNLLQQGHLDPRQSLSIPDNCIPICGDCNTWQLDRFVLDHQGRIITVLPVPSNHGLFRDLNDRERRSLAHMITTPRKRITRISA